MNSVENRGESGSVQFNLVLLIARVISMLS